jgi:hypothetical protein
MLAGIALRTFVPSGIGIHWLFGTTLSFHAVPSLTLAVEKSCFLIPEEACFVSDGDQPAFVLAIVFITETNASVVRVQQFVNPPTVELAAVPVR